MHLYWARAIVQTNRCTVKLTDESMVNYNCGYVLFIICSHKQHADVD